ncbi:MAG: hypothetical protein ACT4PJ_13910 [Gemmatimonadaceae bacterium]
MTSLESTGSEVFLSGIERIGLAQNRVPDLADVNRRLAAITGWAAVGVAGFIPAVQFFCCLARRRFPTTLGARPRARSSTADTTRAGRSPPQTMARQRREAALGAPPPARDGRDASAQVPAGRVRTRRGSRQAAIKWPADTVAASCCRPLLAPQSVEKLLSTYFAAKMRLR